jgi:Bacterial protein of unknown function (Gcw_chp)
VLDPHPSRPAPAGVLLAWLLLLAASLQPGYAVELPGEFTLGGSLALTSDYLYRGVSESNGHEAFQADLHLENGGTFIGAWGSTRDRSLDPYADYDVEIYLGQRFDLSSAWSATLSARAHYFVGGTQESSDDYEQLSGSLTYLDRWTLSLAAIPNAVHYWYELRLGRSPAWVADTSGQWLLPVEGLFVTGGAGYYYASRIAPDIGTGYDYAGRSGPDIGAGGGYAYGNAGLAFEHRHWRLDVGYFVAQGKARQLIPYPVPSDRLAGSVVWRF